MEGGKWKLPQKYHVASFKTTTNLGAISTNYY